MKKRIFYGSGAQHLKGNGGGEIQLEVFPSGERFCKFTNNIRGDDVFLVQSLFTPVNDNLMELLVMADAARRASARRITFVMPYMGYQRQDRKTSPREPISAKLTIDMMQCAGANRLMTIDAHNLAAQGFTNLPFDHLFGSQLFAEHFKSLNELENTVFVSPDIGAIKRAQVYADTFGVGFAIVNKKRLSPTEVKANSLIGDVEGKDVIIVDDLTESCNTLIAAGEICRKNGAKTIRVAVTHNCLHDEGFYNLARAMGAGVIDEFITTNTVCEQFETTCEAEKRTLKQMVILDVSPLLLTAIDRTHKNESITELFQVKGI